MKRRTFLRTALAVAALFTLPLAMQAGRERKGPMTKTTQTIQKIDKSEAEWRQALTPEQFDVLRKEATERPFTSSLNKQYGDGVYICAGCDLPLFESSAKFDSGTGWPSFYAPIDGHTETRRDFKMLLPRTEYHCVRCGGHQGHIFNDGPKPTGQRWCNNGVALKFIPA
jgi:peptide-methionine (R)-S-oxide reductase